MTDKTETTYLRPEGTRDALKNAIKVLRDIADNIHMPGDFAVKARNLCIDMDNEVNRKEGEW
jgi:hypothetical protein